MIYGFFPKCLVAIFVAKERPVGNWNSQAFWNQTPAAGHDRQLADSNQSLCYNKFLQWPTRVRLEAIGKQTVPERVR